MAKKWTEEDNQYILDHFQDMDNQALAKKYGVTPKAIQGKLRRLGLKRTTKPPKTVEPEPTAEKPVELSLERKRAIIAEILSPVPPPDLRSTSSVHSEPSPDFTKAVELLNAGIKKLQQGKRDQAFEILSSIEKKQPRELRVINKAHALIAQHGKHEAFRLSKHPQEEELAQYALAMYHTANFGKALEVFLKLAKQHPGESAFNYNVACLMSIEGRREEALEYLKRAVEQNPEHALEAYQDEDFLRLKGDETFQDLLLEHLEIVVQEEDSRERIVVRPRFAGVS